jgi:peroxiredoxin Q/BCP
MALTIGSTAPKFSLPATGGGVVSSDALAGRRYVLYFYPRDNTPGCTTEACDFRDNFARLKKAGIEVFGVSKDSIKSHDGFTDKYSLPFRLLSDADNAVAKAFGAYGEKKMYGKPVIGTIRSTFLVGENGKIEAVWSPVKVAGHVDAVLAAARGEREVVATKGAAAAKKAASAKKGAAKKK